MEKKGGGGGLKLFDSFGPNKRKSIAQDIGPHFFCVCVGFMAQSKASFAPPQPHQIYQKNH